MASSVTFIVCFLAAFEMCLSAQQGGTPAEIVKKVGEDYFQWKLREFPTWASEQGFHQYDDKLEEYSLKAFERRKDEMTVFLDQIKDLTTSTLTPMEMQNWKVLKAELETYVDGYKWRGYGASTPVTRMGGVSPSGWISNMNFKTAADYEKMKMRLKAVPTQIDDQIALMRTAIASGITRPCLSMDAVPAAIDIELVVYMSTEYYKPYTDMLENSQVPQSDWDALRDAAKITIEDEIKPALERLKAFIVNDYIPNCASSISATSYPDGEAYYDACIKFHLGVSMSAKDIQDIGRREVTRIKAEMEKILNSEGFTGTIPQFFEYLKVNRSSEFYGRTKEQLLARYTDIINNVIQPKMNLVIHNVPSQVARVEEKLGRGPAEYINGVFFAAVNPPEEKSTFLMLATTLHETSPGHHLQNILAIEQDFPDFRRYISGHNYQAAPYVVPWHTAYTEGWGLYSEFLGEEMGVYNKTALELFGRYVSEIFRACRLVVDTGVHAFGMTFDEAVQYIADHTSMSRSSIESEVKRYITWPGQACSYKIGDVTIQNARKKASEQLGPAFDVRDFNEHVLGVGRVPLSVMNEAIDEWIDSNKTLTTPVSHAGLMSYLYDVFRERIKPKT